MKRLKRTVSMPILALSFLLTCVVCLFANSAFVYALPEPVTGWVEVQCSSIPEGFSDTATAVFSNTETGETYTIHCQKINGYLARMKVPAGKYQVDHVSTTDNFTYEAFTEVTDFEITENMPAAQLIPLTIIQHNTPSDVPLLDETAVSVLPENLTEPVPDTADSRQDADSTEGSAASQNEENAVLDMIDKMAGPDAPEAPEETQAGSTDHQVLPSLGKVCLVLLGSGVFAAVVFGCAWMFRKHFEEQ